MVAYLRRVNLVRHVLPFGRESYKWKTDIKIHLKLTLCRLDLFGSGKVINIDAFELDNRNLDSVKKNNKELVVQISDCQLFK